MAAIGARVRYDPELHCCERAVRACAQTYLGDHRVARRGAGELLLAREFPFHRPPGLHGGEHAETLAQHLLLAAKPAADPLGECVDVTRPQTEDVAELLLGDERGL